MPPRPPRLCVFMTAGAETPTRPSAVSSTWRMASTQCRRAAVFCQSQVARQLATALALLGQNRVAVNLLAAGVVALEFAS